MSRKAVVIGSGVAGLAVAIRLAVQGYKVDVFEANDYLGGKLSEFSVDGFRFDAGPSLFTMPQLVDDLYTLAGKNPKDHFHYQRLASITKYFYEDGTQVNAWAEPERLADELERQLGEPKENTLSALKKSQELYDLTAHIFLRNSLHNVQAYLTGKALSTLAQLHKIDAFRTMHDANSRRFKNAKTVQLFNRYATYNGSDPYQAPATLNIIPHLEFNMGAYFPKGGMYSITKSLAALASELGVQFYLSSQVEEIVCEKGTAIGVMVKGSLVKAEVVVSNMDIVQTYRKLLRTQKAPEKLLNRPKSSSALIFYWGIDREFPSLELHNIFFSNDYREEFQHLFQRRAVSNDPTVYVNISSKMEPTDAPEGMENWFVMINVPNNSGQDWEQIKQQARQHIITKLSRILGVEIQKHIIAEKVLDPVLIEQRTSSYQGALYGNSSNDRFAAFLRHANFHSDQKGLYFCGGSVHPGGGIPLCLLSAEITAGLITKREPKP
ncbi:MAG: 1-hydroxycarotenoid 3,4-desaturase CrtD [Chitinophagales bacterium]|nr:1-hydroxycarotenoid 3,4-desaturase CrtD [Chitinophagales bacterium]